MQACQLCSCPGQAHFSGADIVTGAATELLEPLNSSKLRRRTLIFGHLDDDGHRLQGGNASFESLRPFPALLRKAELSLLADGVALPATLTVEQVLGTLSLALSGSNHLVQRGGGRLAPSRG